MAQPEDSLGHQKEAVSVREYLELKIQALEERLTAALKAAQEAIHKAENFVDERLSKLNELHKIVSDQRATFATKEWVEQLDKATNEKLAQQQKTSDEKIAELTKRVNELETFRAVIAGKASVPANLLSIVLGVIALIIGIANIIGMFGGK